MGMSGACCHWIPDFSIVVPKENGAMPTQDASGLLEELRATLYSIGDAVITTDASGAVVRMNPQAEALTGWTEAAAAGLPLPEVFCIENEETGERMEDPVARVLRERRIVGLANHTQLVDRTGRRRPIADSGAPILDGHGRLLGVVLVFRDQSAEREKERRIAESEARYRSFYEYSPVGMHFYELDDDGNLVFRAANPAAQSILGIRHEDLIGKTIEEAFPPLKHTEIPERYRNCVQKGEVWSTDLVEYQDGRISGAYRVTAFPVGGTRMVAMFDDETAMRKLQAERNEAERRFHQAQRLEAVGRLAGGVAHDFNNMLSIINGVCDVLLGDLPPDHPMVRDLRDIREAGRRSADLVRQLLGFARRQFSTPRLLDLRMVVESLLGMVRRAVGEQVDLRWQPADQACMVCMDPAQVDQIVTNLVVNARDALGQEGGCICVSVEPSSEPGTGAPAVLLQVKDNGCGMPPEVLEHAFEPFFTTKKAGEGTGLGLASVHGIVAQNGGTIRLDSRPGNGTTVSVFLPRREGAATASADPGAPEVPAASRIVLLVEDEPAVLRIECRMLEKLGCRVIAAAGGEEALEMAMAWDGPIHVLLTDVMMPRIGGIRLARELSGRYPGLQVVFMSGYFADMVNAGEFVGNFQFLQKPFSLEQLADVLRKLEKNPG